MAYSVVVSVFATALLYASLAPAQENRVPDLRLMVTVQQRQDSKTETGFHILTLSCSGGNCALTTVTLNTCARSGPGADAFYPGVQHSSTRDGNMVVRNIGNTLVVDETGWDIGGQYTNSLRFEYEPTKAGEPISYLVGFSGGFVKNSLILNKILTVEYVPLVGVSQVRKLDCGVLLPGVWK